MVLCEALCPLVCNVMVRGSALSQVKSFIFISARIAQIESNLAF